MFPMQQRKLGRPIEELVGEQVAAARSMRGLTQREFAAKLTQAGMPVDASAVSRIEKGARSIRLAEALTVADVLEVDIAFLFRGILTPEQEFRQIRQSADIGLAGLADSFLQAANGLLEARLILHDNPALLGQLKSDPRLSSPNEVSDLPQSSDEYLPWVAKNIQAKPLDDNHVVHPHDQEEADQLTDLFRIWIAARIRLNRASDVDSVSPEERWGVDGLDLASGVGEMVHRTPREGFDDVDRAAHLLYEDHKEKDHAWRKAALEAEEQAEEDNATADVLDRMRGDTDAQEE